MYMRKLTVGIQKGTLIDIETTGLDPALHEIVAFGYIQGSELRIICRKSEDETHIKNKIKKICDELPEPYYAYNLPFEQSFILKKIGKTIKGKDLFKLWKEKAEKKYIKWPKLDELISLPEMYFGEPVTTGERVPMLWKAYLKTKDEAHLKLIIRHNETDLLREMCLLLLYPLER